MILIENKYLFSFISEKENLVFSLSSSSFISFIGLNKESSSRLNEYTFPIHFLLKCNINKKSK